MHSTVFGEFFGTMVLIAFGDGCVANLVLKDTKGNGAGWLHVNWAWCWAVIMGAFAAQATGSAGADLNPAVTLAKLMAGGYTTDLAIQLMGAQFVGAFVGAVIVYLAYLNHWEGTDAGSPLGPSQLECHADLLGVSLRLEIRGIGLVGVARDVQADAVVIVLEVLNANAS